MIVTAKPASRAMVALGAPYMRQASPEPICRLVSPVTGGMSGRESTLSVSGDSRGSPAPRPGRVPARGLALWDVGVAGDPMLWS